MIMMYNKKILQIIRYVYDKDIKECAKFYEYYERLKVEDNE